MSSPASRAPGGVESDDRGVRTLWFDQPGRSLQRAGPAGDRRAGIAPRRPRGEPRDPGLHHPQRQARRLLRGDRPPLGDPLRACRPRSSTCSGAGSRCINRLARDEDPHRRGHPWRLPGRRPGAGPGLPAPRGARLGGAPAGRAARDPPRPGPRLGRHHPAPADHRSRRGARPAAHRPIDRLSPRTVARPGRPAGLRGGSRGGARPGAAAGRGSRRARRNPGSTSSSRPASGSADQPGAHPEVQRRILAIVELDIERGPEAAQEAAVRGFAELAMSPETREAITWFFQRKLIPATSERHRTSGSREGHGSRAGRIDDRPHRR